LQTESANQRRIIVTGASGVGKTTLVEKLAPLLHLQVIPELGRAMCKERGFERVGDIPDQLGFKNDVLTKQIEEEERLGSFISDRSTIDCWVLWQRWDICQAMTYDTEAYHDRAFQQAKKYTQIIYVPPRFPAPEDGFRWTEPDYQKQIDRICRMTLYDWNLWQRTFVVQSDEPQKRLSEIEEWLGCKSP